MSGRQTDKMTPEGEARILKRLRENLLPRQVVESTGYTYAQVAGVIRKNGGLNAIKKAAAGSASEATRNPGISTD